MHKETLKQTFPCIWNGIPIKKKKNRVTLYLDGDAYIELLEGIKETGFNIMQHLSYSSKPCEHCKNTPVITFQNGEKQEIQRGFLYKHLKMTNHGNIHKLRETSSCKKP